jgi:PAS domain S-box-containing protein
MSHNDFGFLFDDNPNPMWIYELSTLRILKVNNISIKKYGFSEDEFLRMTIVDLRPDDEQNKLYAYLDELGINKLLIPGLNHGGMWKHQTKGGDLIYAEIISHEIKFNGADCRIVVATDVSERVKYQEEVIQRELELVWTKNSLEALINNTEDQIWSVDKEFRYVYMNKAYCASLLKLTGIEPREGDHFNQHRGYNKQLTQTWNKYYTRALAGENYKVITESIDPETKNVLSFEISFNPIYKTENEITGVGCFARNITERLKTEKALIDQNDRLRLIASLTSHELRRPVASMLGLINIMDRANFFNPDNKEIIEHLLTVGKEIDDVIRQIVDKTITDHISKTYLSP